MEITFQAVSHAIKQGVMRKRYSNRKHAVEMNKAKEPFTVSNKCQKMFLAIQIKIIRH